jgi:hypothetical protein
MIKFPLMFIDKAPGIRAWWRRVMCRVQHGGHLFPRTVRSGCWRDTIKCLYCDATYVYSDTAPSGDRDPPPKR